MSRARLLEHPRLVEVLPLLLGAAVFAACLVRIRQRWFIPGYSGHGYTVGVVASTVDGYARAPNQYRLFMPHVMTWAAEVTGMALPTAVLAVDAALLAALLVLVWRLALAAGRVELMLAAAAVYGLWVAKLDHWHPEVMALTVLVTAVTLLVWPARPSGWAILGVVACGVAMYGMRADYAAALGVALLVLGAARRDWRCAVAGLVVGSGAVAAMVALVDAYPSARYLVPVVQLPYNLSLGSWLLVAAFYGPVVAAPVLLLARDRRLAPALWFPLVWFAALFAAVFVAGRVEESRIFLPLAPALGVAAGAAYLQLRVSREGEVPSWPGRRWSSPC